jgi:hypothetical protein
MLELFFHNPKFCIDYKHWIHHCNKTMKQFYISTKKTCVLDLMGGEPQPMGWFFIIHTFAMESLSFFSPLIHEKEKKNKNFLRYVRM